MSELPLTPVSELYQPHNGHTIEDAPIDDPSAPYASHEYTIAYESDSDGNPVPEGGNTAIFAIAPGGMTEPVFVTKPEADATFTVTVLSGNGRLVRANQVGEVDVTPLKTNSEVVVRPGDAYSYHNSGSEPLVLHDVALPAFKTGDDVNLCTSELGAEAPVPEPGFSVVQATSAEGQLRRISLPNRFWRLVSGVESPVVTAEDTVRRVQTPDLDGLRPLLEKWLRNSETKAVIHDEVNSVLSAIAGSIEGKNDRTYLVTEAEDGSISGVMGVKTPEADMQAYATTERPLELVNAYVDPQSRSKGIGRVLASQLEKVAVQSGATEIIVNSGPRYKETGWPFWTSLYGEPATVALNFYDEGVDAPVWRKPL